MKERELESRNNLHFNKNKSFKHWKDLEAKHTSFPTLPSPFLFFQIILSKHSASYNVILWQSMFLWLHAKLVWQSCVSINVQFFFFFIYFVKFASLFRTHGIAPVHHAFFVDLFVNYKIATVHIIFFNYSCFRIVCSTHCLQMFLLGHITQSTHILQL